MAELVRMVREADGKVAEVHPDMVEEYERHGDYRREAAAAMPSMPAAKITKSAIARMAKADVVELLAAHGVPDATGNVGDLRTQLTEIMFTDL